MNKNPQIICENLDVIFPLFDLKSRSWRAALSGQKTSVQPHSFHTLKNINLSISQGDRIGLIGKNGAGKSTFLRTLAGVYKPKSGQIKRYVDTTSLFDIAVGTDADATGYENIPLLMASRGIPKTEYQKVVHDVETFTELGDALHRPLRTYSSGMRLRIAFAVATYQIQGVLLMDEVIGVGDASFRKKSTQRIQKLMQDAATLVIASHSRAVLKAHCNRGIVFDNGEVIFDGDIDEANDLVPTSK